MFRWVGFECTGFAGEQYVLEKGQYPCWSTWTNNQSSYYLSSFRPLKLVNCLCILVLVCTNVCVDHFAYLMSFALCNGTFTIVEKSPVNIQLV